MIAKDNRVRTSVTAFILMGMQIFAAGMSNAAPINVPVPSNYIYLGVLTGEGLSPQTIEKAIGRKFDFVDVSQGYVAQFGNGSILKGLQKLGQQNPIVMITMHPPQYSLADTVANKSHNGGLPPDTFYARWATALRDYGKPVFLRWNHEMNAVGFQYCTANSIRCVDLNTGKQQTPADYVAAWRHVHDIFEKGGATNVSWVWCPSYNPGPGDEDFGSLAQLYPGDNYVDWTCLDVYNNTLVQRRWESFSEVFDLPHRKIRAIAPNKPFMIGEINSMADPGNPQARADWFHDAMLVQIPKYPDIKAFTLWEVDRSSNTSVAGRRRIDWRVESDPPVLQVFREAISRPPYSAR